MRHLALLLVVIALLLPTQAVQAAKKPQLKFLGIVDLGRGVEFEKTVVGGLSAIAYDEKEKVFWTVCDSSNSGGARLYKIRIDISGEGLLTGGEVVGVLQLRSKQGHLEKSLDLEGIAIPSEGKAWLSHEGTRGISAHPWVRLYSLKDGKQLGEAALPISYIPEFKMPKGLVRGVQPNRSLESLTLSPDGKSLFTASEQSLRQDEDATGTALLLRIIRFAQDDKGEWTPAEAKPYRVDQGGIFLSLSELLAQDDQGTLLALERKVSGMLGTTGDYQFRIYRIHYNQEDVPGILGKPWESADQYPTLKKELVFDSRRAGLPPLDNVEGLCFGPVINGKKTLFLVADDNFKPHETTQILALQLP